ncbi:MAG: divergent polysaccharide deacetylase family protein [Pararhodobacter sp.]|nr:divergent polysaccharide deacetylase family protein [Pararhodobacter sp.]
MGGFIKGMAVGLVCFALGFAALTVVLEQVYPPDPVAVPEPVAEPEEADGPEALVAEDGATTSETVPDLPDLPAGQPETDAPDEDAGARIAEPEVTSDPSPGDVLRDEAADDIASEAETAAQADADPVQPDAGNAADETPAPEPSAPEPSATETTIAEPEATAPDAAPTPDVVPDPEAVGEVTTGDDPVLEPAPAPVEAPHADDMGADDTGAGDQDSEEPTGNVTTTTESAPTLPQVLRAVPSSPGLEREIDGVTVGRLPSIPATEPAEATDEAEAETAEDAGDETLPARERYAAPFERAPGPLFAIILDDASADPDAEVAILALPMPVSVALDPQDPDAPRRAQAYRAAGHEIVMLAAGLPAGATPSDLEVTFDGWFRALPETVALLDPPQGGFQGNRALAQALMPFLAADGHGLVTYERGLNPARQSANSAGVANTSVFRIIDSDNENQHTIRRYLDRATFRAQQEGQVVVMGRAAHAETIAGLIGWRMEGRAGQVLIVPVSATLR